MSDRFVEVEAEVERRDLVGPREMLDIERGVVYAGMDLRQALASMDDLEEVDLAIIKGALIRTFRGRRRSPVGWSRASRRDTVIACEGRVVTLYVNRGLITAETYSGTFGSSQIKFQTNFRPGFWDPENDEQRRRGPRVHDDQDDFADRVSHVWSMFSNNSGAFSPSEWLESGKSNWGPRGRDTMGQLVRSDRPVC